MNKKTSRLLALLAEGFVGAVVLTLAHETTRKNVKRSPRLDLLGERSITEGMRALGLQPPRGRALRRWAMAGDIVANTIYYAALASRGHRALAMGVLGGVAAGTGALTFPEKLGLGKMPKQDDPIVKALTLALYTLGGAVAGGAGKVAEEMRDEPREHVNGVVKNGVAKNGVIKNGVVKNGVAK